MLRIPRAAAVMELLDDPWPEHRTAERDLCEPDVDDDEHDEIESDHGHDHQTEMQIFEILSPDPIHDHVLLEPLPDPCPVLDGVDG